jgi:hypothetical protein
MSPRLGEHPLSFHHKLNFLKSFPLFIFSGDSCPFARKSQKKVVVVVVVVEICLTDRH